MLRRISPICAPEAVAWQRRVGDRHSCEKNHFQRALASASARDRVTNLFGQHVSPRVVERLLAVDAAEFGEIRRVCVMFVDIRGFTEAARQRTPAEVVARASTKRWVRN